MAEEKKLSGPDFAQGVSLNEFSDGRMQEMCALMTSLADIISTVVLVVLENRSFDHMLGHLTYEGLLPGIKGLETDLSKYQNQYAGGEYLPFRATERQLLSDLPHEWNQVATQFADSAVTQQFDMTGFVEAHAALTGTQPAPGWQLFRDVCPGGKSPSETGARADRLVSRVIQLWNDVESGRSMTAY